MEASELKKTKGKLKPISPDLIDRNEDNPRVFFRPEELEDLLASIARIGVQVPITVYPKGDRYVLIDGERRWRCAKKLNLQTIPALIIKVPTPLENLLLMFNIHSLREDWDLFTISMKLPTVITLLEKQNSKYPTEVELSVHTGLNRATIRRCKLLIGLPDKYKDIAFGELKLPKRDQKLTEDFFLEMERCLSVVNRYFPGVIDNIDHARDVFIKKYRKEIISNILQFRKVSKIARSDKLGVPRERAISVLQQLFQDNDYSIEQAFSESAEEVYNERTLENRLQWLIENIGKIDESREESEAIYILLRKLKIEIGKLLGGH